LIHVIVPAVTQSHAVVGRQDYSEGVRY
jgi:hypothetical protein